MNDILGYTQAGYWFSVTTPFGDDELLLKEFEFSERISSLFHLRLTMASEHDDLDFTRIVGQPVTVSGTDDNGRKSCFHGIVGRFRQDGRIYTADVYPKMWELTLASDNRIFQNQSVPDIVTAVLQEHGITDLNKDNLTGTYPLYEYCVQYGETTFNFVSRLLEQEGIFYYFKHSDDKHTLMLADQPPNGPNCYDDLDAVNFKAGATRVWDEPDVVIAAGVEEVVVPGKYRASDYEFTTPSTSLLCETGNGSRSLYEYPGLYAKKDDGDARVKIRLDEAQSLAKTLWGESICPTFRSGHKFTLAKHPRAAANTEYVLYSIEHRGGEGRYANRFVAFPSNTAFRPPRSAVKPRLTSIQTAKVVGKQGDEIYTDEYGRIKVQFHWDQLGQKNENSSCWIRVAHGWAGKNWGAIWLPRIEQEVVVAFLDGDPDRPLVVGSVYNGEQPVPYALADNITRSTLKSNTSKGGGGFNEIRFEDKKDSEELYLHAEKDMNVAVVNDLGWTVDHNESATVGYDRSVTLIEGNDKLTVRRGTRTVTVTGSDTRTSKAGFTHEVTGDFTLKVDGSITIQATGAITLKSGTSLTLDAGTSLTLKAGASLSGSAGTNLSLAGNVNAELKGGASANVEGSGMLTLKGGMVKIN